MSNLNFHWRTQPKQKSRREPILVEYQYQVNTKKNLKSLPSKLPASVYQSSPSFPAEGYVLAFQTTLS